jgi:hypothetical protein
MRAISQERRREGMELDRSLKERWVLAWRWPPDLRKLNASLTTSVS